MKIIAGVLIEKDNKYLLVQEGQGAAKDLWIFPAGGIDEGETPEQAAAREAKEEAGLSVEIMRRLGTFHGFGPEDTEFHVFAGKIISGEAKAGPEIADAKYFSAEELQTMQTGNQLRGNWTLGAIKAYEKL